MSLSFSKEGYIVIPLPSAAVYQQNRDTPQDYGDVKYWISKGGVDINQVNGDGVGALSKASREGNLKMVKFLISKGAKIKFNEKIKNRNSPFLAAVRNGRLNVTRFWI